MEVEGRVAIKACTTINLPFDTCLPFFKDPLLLKYLQDNVQKIDFLYHSDNKRVVHILSKLPGPVSDRQIIAVNTFQQEGDRVMVGDRSIDFKANLHKDAVLGHVYVGGFIIEKVDSNRTKVINITDIDPKGSIPGFVKNGIAGKRA